MKSKLLCAECRLTVFAGSEKELAAMASKFTCNCGKPPVSRAKAAKEYIGTRKIKISPANIWYIKDLYK